MRRFSRVLTTVATLTLMAACDSVTGPEPTDEAFFDGRELDAASLAAGDPAGYDAAATDLPGFGGLWFDARCNLNVVLTAEGNPERTKEALTPLLRRYLEANRCPRGATIIIHRGMFTYVELTRWLHELRPVAEIRGVVSIALNIPINRIVIGVANRDVAAEVFEAVRRLGVPGEAVVLRVGDASGRDRTGTTTTTRRGG